MHEESGFVQEISMTSPEFSHEPWEVRLAEPSLGCRALKDLELLAASLLRAAAVAMTAAIAHALLITT